MYASKNYKLLVKALLPPIIYKMVDLPLRTKKIRLKLRNQIKILKKWIFDQLFVAITTLRPTFSFIVDGPSQSLRDPDNPYSFLYISPSLRH